MNIKFILSLIVIFPCNAFAGVMFDFTGGSGPVQDVGSFDWQVGNALAHELNDDDDTFDLLVHSVLGSTVDSAGNPNPTDPALNDQYEITIVIKIEEDILIRTDDFTQFVSTGGFVEIYYDDTPDSNALTGSGYNDGTLIYLGEITPGSKGNFTLGTEEQNFDQSSDGDDYSGFLTLPGFGSNDIIYAATNFFNPAFFNGNPSISLELSNVSGQTPFNSVNPSDCFINGSGGEDQAACINSFGPWDDNNTGLSVVPELGEINSRAGVDFQLQTDFNSPINVAAIPEPDSILILGFGMIALFGFLRRKA